jgi:hypothetical protein
VALKYRVIERQQINAVPLTIRQLAAALRPFAADAPGASPFEPARLHRLLEAWVAAALAAETAEDWLAGIDAALRRWLAAQGAPPVAPEIGAAPVPLPLF